MVKNDQNTSFWQKNAKKVPFWSKKNSNSGNLLISPIPVSHNFFTGIRENLFWADLTGAPPIPK